MNKKTNDKESTLCLTPKTSPQKFPKKLNFLYGLHQAQHLTPLVTLRKQNKCNFPSKYWFA